jgi:hypothetical protein
MKRKLYSCNANLYFNRQCIQRRLTPNYAKIKIPGNSPAAKHTLRKAQAIRIKDELRFLHIKSQQLNHQLFRLHLSLADTWGKLWPHIQERIEESLQETIRYKYKTLDIKLLRLTQQQTTTPKNPTSFCPQSSQYNLLSNGTVPTKQRPQVQPTQKEQTMAHKPSTRNRSSH